MAQIPKESIEQVLNATDIVALIQGYGIDLKRAGSRFKANCPFHNEKTPSFHVNPSMQRYHCFGCGVGGDAISFVREYENLPFMDAVRKLAAGGGVTIREEVEDPLAEKRRKHQGRLKDLHRESARFFHELLLKDPAAAHAREYLKGRGYGREMAERWVVGWMPENGRVFLDWVKSRNYTGRELCASGMAALRDEENPRAGLYVRFRDRLMFPICNEIGDVIAFSGRQLREDKRSGKYVNSPETEIFKKSQVLFALDKAKKPMLKEKSAVLCEGQIDAIACHEAGVEHAIAAQGTAFTPEQAKKLRRYTPEVLICFDADSAGLSKAEAAFRELAAEGLAVRVVEMPEGDDPDTFLKRDGAEAFRALLTNAREFFDFKLARAKAVGALESAAGRASILTDCSEVLSTMKDFASRENQINVVASYLQTSATVLRQEIKRLQSNPRRQQQQRQRTTADPVTEQEVVEPTSLHRIVAFLCHLALTSEAAQQFLGEQFESLHEASRWMPGVPVLEAILSAGPDPQSSGTVNAFLSSLPQADQLALQRQVVIDGAPEDGLQAAEHALVLLSGLVLQRRDAAVKAALKEPGLTSERMVELLQESKEISVMLRDFGQRSEFDDEHPPSTYKEPEPEWKKRWRARQAEQGKQGGS